MNLQYPETRLDPRIPTLNKKEEKERRGVGFFFYPWGAGSRALSSLFGGPGTFLGALWASPLGTAILVAGTFAWIALAAVLARSLLGGGQSPSGGLSREFFPVLDPAKPAGLRVASPKDRSLDFVRRANAGALSFNQEPVPAVKGSAQEPSKDAPNGGPKTGAQPAVPSAKVSSVNELLQKGLGREGFVRKLSDGSSLALGANLNANKLKSDNFELKKTFAPAGTKTEFKLISFSRRPFRNLDGAAQRAAASGASRAMGQLKFAASKSQQAYKTSDAGESKQAATDAFEQGKTTGQGTIGLSSSEGDVVVPASTSNDTYSVPGVGTSTNTTPYQNQVDSAKNSSDNAGLYKAIGIALLIAGAALITTGIGLLNCTTFPIGMALIAMGTGLLILGAIFLALGIMEADGASNAGSNIGNNYGQTGQGSTISSCANKSYETGTNTNTVCGNSSSYDTSQGNSVSQDTQKESTAFSAQ